MAQPSSCQLLVPYSPKMLSKSEKSYIRTSLLSDPPLRADGRSLLDFRGVALELCVTALANGSARARIGGDAGSDSAGGGVCGTEVLVAVKLEVEDVSGGNGNDKGRLTCNVSWYVLDYTQSLEEHRQPLHLF